MSWIDWKDFLVHNGYDYIPDEDCYVNKTTGKKVDYFEAMRDSMGVKSVLGDFVGGLLGSQGVTASQLANQAMSQQASLSQAVTGIQQSGQSSWYAPYSQSSPMTGGLGVGTIGGIIYGSTGQFVMPNSPTNSPPYTTYIGPAQLNPVPGFVQGLQKYVGLSQTTIIGTDYVTVWWNGTRWTTEWEDVEPLIAKQAIKGDSGATADELEEAQKIIEELSRGQEAQI